jgi:hypothetical protein
MAVPQEDNDSIYPFHPLPDPCPPPVEARMVIGTWKLTRSELSPTAVQARGANPIGMVVYDPNGYMSVQIMPDRPRNAFPSYSPTPEQARDALLGYAAYFGYYRINLEKGTIAHCRIGSLTFNANRILVRRFEVLDNDTLVLRPIESEHTLYWKRLTRLCQPDE